MSLSYETIVLINTDLINILAAELDLVGDLNLLVRDHLLLVAVLGLEVDEATSELLDKQLLHLTVFRLV